MRKRNCRTSHSRLIQKSNVSSTDEYNQSDKETQPSKGKFHFPDNAIILPYLCTSYLKLKGPDSNYVTTEKTLNYILSLSTIKRLLNFLQIQTKKDL